MCSIKVGGDLVIKDPEGHEEKFGLYPQEIHFLYRNRSMVRSVFQTDESEGSREEGLEMEKRTKWPVERLLQESQWQMVEV